MGVKFYTKNIQILYKDVIEIFYIFTNFATIFQISVKNYLTKNGNTAFKIEKPNLLCKNL